MTISDPRSQRHRRPLLLATLLAILLAGVVACGDAPGPGDATDPSPEPDQDAPQETDEEGVVEIETDAGTAAAELVVEPVTISGGEQAIVRVENHGELPLGYGRPIEVERWEGEGWARWEPADEVMWTMEMLLVEPGGSGEEQPFPFTEQDPEPGLYRLTKIAFAEVEDADAPQLTIRARIEVTG
jgi:hypothetical protein